MRLDQPLPPLHRPAPPPAPPRGLLRWWSVVLAAFGLVLAGALVLKLHEAGANQDAIQAANQDASESARPVQLAQRQQQTPAQRTQPAPGGAQSQAAAAQPAAAKPAAAKPQRSEQIVQDTWVITCVETAGAGAQRTCSAVQHIVEAQQKRVLFAWVIGRTPEGVLTNVFQTPTGVLIQKGLDLKLGNANPRRANYVVCITQRCEASLPMDDAVIKEARAALSANAVASVAAADGRTINFSMPLKGIDKVLATLGR